MYLAEISGKVTSKIEGMEDVLTSNVFSFFKYADRDQYLRSYLNSLGINVSSIDSKEAKFLFWPKFEDGTEPDLIICVGKYYILIEAKYFSEFSEQNEKSESQIIRELNEGLSEARNQSKEFKYITITADYYFIKEKFDIIPKDKIDYFIWTNWQKICTFLYEKNIIEKQKEDSEFAFDLYRLLEKKKLRNYNIKNLTLFEAKINKIDSIFYNSLSSKYRGDFLGFIPSLKRIAIPLKKRENIFFQQIKNFYFLLYRSEKMGDFKNQIFYKG